MPDGKSLLLSDGVHSLPDGALARPLQLQGVVAAVDPSGKLAVTAFKENLLLWDIASGRKLLDCSGSLNPQAQAAFSPDGTRFVSSGGRFARVWDVKTGACIHKLKKHEGQTIKARFSPDGSKILSLADGDYQVKTWDASAGAELTAVTMFAHEGGAPWMDMPHDAAWSIDGANIVAGSCTLSVWDAATGRNVTEIGGDGGHFSSVAMHPDGKTCIAAVFHMDGDAVSMVVLRAIDLAGVQVTAELQVEAATDLRLTLDGARLVAQAVDTVDVYEIALD